MAESIRKESYCRVCSKHASSNYTFPVCISEVERVLAWFIAQNVK